MDRIFAESLIHEIGVAAHEIRSNDRPLAKAEPKTLRYRLLHPAARLVRGQRKRKIKIPESWPWARELEACFLAVFALRRRRERRRQFDSPPGHRAPR